MIQPDRSTAPPSASIEPLPERWIARIFARLHGRFGAPFLSKFQSGVLENERDTGVENAKRVWAHELAGFSEHEIADGLRARYDFPPSCDAFAAACRPPVDPKEAWLEAREQMALRMQGKGEDRWSNPRVYWAAVKIGNYKLQQLDWRELADLWHHAIKTASVDEVPVYIAPPPAPPPQPVSRDMGRNKAASLRATILSLAGNLRDRRPGTIWAERLLRREAGGESLTIYAAQIWREVLGFPAELGAGDALAAWELRQAEDRARLEDAA